MCRFIETIQIKDGELKNLIYHDQRMNETRKTFFNASQSLDIRNHIKEYPPEGLYKCRIVYEKEVCEVSISSYIMKEVHSLQAIYCDNIDYQYKSLNRIQLNKLYEQRGNQNDILIVKNSLITDTSIANIAVEKEGKWYTPATPLLRGTKRALLIEKGVITETDIPAKDIYTYSRIALFNAMIDFGSLVLDIKQDTIIL